MLPAGTCHPHRQIRSNHPLLVFLLLHTTVSQKCIRSTEAACMRQICANTSVDFHKTAAQERITQEKRQTRLQTFLEEHVGGNFFCINAALKVSVSHRQMAVSLELQRILPRVPSGETAEHFLQVSPSERCIHFHSDIENPHEMNFKGRSLGHGRDKTRTASQSRWPWKRNATQTGQFFFFKRSGT